MVFNIKAFNYYKNNFKPNEISEVKKDFIYYPLQQEPELSSTIIKNNQVITSFEMLILAREKFDKNIQLVCKDNPAQLLFNRSPDFFKLTGDNLCGVIELDNLKWVYESVQGYKNIFDGYVAASPLLENETHIEVNSLGEGKVWVTNLNGNIEELVSREGLVTQAGLWQLQQRTQQMD